MVIHSEIKQNSKQKRILNFFHLCLQANEILITTLRKDD